MKKFAIVLAGLTLTGLLSVFLEVEAVRVGYKIRKDEESKVQLLDRARALKYNIARLEAPNNLERRLAAQKIALESPKAWQTLIMPGVKNPAVEVTNHPMFFTKFFVGTAQAEAKESSR